MLKVNNNDDRANYLHWIHDLLGDLEKVIGVDM